MNVAHAKQKDKSASGNVMISKIDSNVNVLMVTPLLDICVLISTNALKV